MFATVRNRRGIVSAVEPFDGEGGRLHLVHLEHGGLELLVLSANLLGDWLRVKLHPQLRRL